MWKNLKYDILPGTIFLISSVIFAFLTPEQIRTTETGFFTARTFPYITLGVIMACSILLIGIGVIRTIGSKGKTAEQTVSSDNAGMALGVFLLVAVAVVIGGMVSLLVSGLFLTIGFLLMYRDRKIMHYIVVIVLVVAFYYLFKLVFGLKLP